MEHEKNNNSLCAVQPQWFANFSRRGYGKHESIRGEKYTSESKTLQYNADDKIHVVYCTVDIGKAVGGRW